MAMIRTMEIRAGEDIIEVGQDLTPPLSPLAFVLSDSHLRSHCSACFSRLSPSQYSLNLLPPDSSSVLYCSSQCYDHDFNLHFTSAEHHIHCSGDSTNIRLALRLLRWFESNDDLIYGETQPTDERIGGLMTNRCRLLSFIFGKEESDLLSSIKQGSKVMGRARRVRDDLLGSTLNEASEYLMEEAILCLVITNAVNVEVNHPNDPDPPVAMAVYDPTFAWINHSCCPNSYWVTKIGESSSCGLSKQRIFPVFSDTGSRCSDFEKYIKTPPPPPGPGINEYGPRIVVRNIKPIRKDEEVTIPFTDLLAYKAIRQSDLWLKYRFVCSCLRCSASPPTYADHALNVIPALNSAGSNLMVVTDNVRDKAVKRLKTCVDGVLELCLSSVDYVSFCQEMQQILLYGYEARSVQILGFHQKLGSNPLHYLSLKAFTNLSSAYKHRADDLLTRGLPVEALRAMRISAAYSLLLAGAAHHLFLSESSLVIPVSNVWVDAGESLHNFAKCPAWDYLRRQRSERWVYRSEVNSEELLQELKRQHNLVENGNDSFLGMLVLNYLSPAVTMLWPFLVQRTTYLESIPSPIDFSWIGSINFSKNINLDGADELELYTEHTRMIINQVGSHCSSYGQFLHSFV